MPGKIFGFNLAAEFIMQNLGDKVLDALKYSDLIFCNKTEALAFAKYLGKHIELDNESETSLSKIA